MPKFKSFAPKKVPGTKVVVCPNCGDATTITMGEQNPMCLKVGCIKLMYTAEENLSAEIAEEGGIMVPKGTLAVAR